MRLIPISEIHKRTQDRRVTHEIGGKFFYVANELRFFKTSTGAPQSNKRVYVELPTEGMIWHTHPPNAGFWPSFEDINRNNPFHILFTKYGVWVYKNNPVKNNPQQVSLMQKIYNEFHAHLERITQNHWTIQMVETHVEAFKKTMLDMFRFEITFVPNWKRNDPKNTNIIKLLNNPV